MSTEVRPSKPMVQFVSSLAELRERAKGWITDDEYAIGEELLARCAMWAADEIERLRAALEQGCPVHGPCPICKAQKWLGDPRVSVSLEAAPPAETTK
jgi:hypothetical protein